MKTKIISYSLISILTTLLALFWAWQTVLGSAQQSFALDYVEIFYEMKTKASNGQVTSTEAINYIESYYPSGTKLHKDGVLEQIVERVRLEVINEIQQLNQRKEKGSAKKGTQLID